MKNKLNIAFFGTPKFSTKILEAMKKEEKEGGPGIVDTRSDLYGRCRHKTRFHRYTMDRTASTDDGSNLERALGDIAVAATNAVETTNPPQMADLLFCQAVTV